MRDFYEFRGKFLRSTFEAYPSGLKKDIINQLSEDERLINGDFQGINFPVVYKQEDGKKLLDILDTGWASRYLISDKLKVLLEDNYLTGWKTYPIKLYDKKMNEIVGYHGFSITGICGPIHYDTSTIIEKKDMNGQACKIYKGEFIEVDKWDKNDFVMATGSLHIIITKKTAEILKMNKISNLKLTRLDEKEIDVDIVEFLKTTRKNKF